MTFREMKSKRNGNVTRHAEFLEFCIYREAMTSRTVILNPRNEDEGSPKILETLRFSQSDSSGNLSLVRRRRRNLENEVIDLMGQLIL